MRRSTFMISSLLVIFLFFGCKPKLHALPNDEIYTCRIHVHVLDDHLARCPIDGLELVKTKLTDEQHKMLEEGDYDRAKE